MTTNFDQIINRYHTNSTKWDDADYLYQAQDVLPFWVADTDFLSPAPVLAALSERAQHGIFGYPSGRQLGFDVLAAWLQNRHGWKIDPSLVVSTPGVCTALSVAVQTFSAPGDKIIIQPPVYPPFFSVIKDNKRTVVENPLINTEDGYRIDFDDLAKKAADAKILILCNPHNPVGRVWTEDELRKIAAICLENDVLILSDEIHSDLIYTGRHTPLASLDPAIAARTITCVAPSKTFNTAGLQASTIIFSNPALYTPFAAAVQALHLAKSNVLGITALQAAYKHGEPWLEELLPYLAANASLLVKTLAEKAPKIRVHLPEGTYLAWLDCRDLGLTQPELRSFFAQEARVGLNDGATFGAQGAGFMRFNFGCPKATLLEGLARIAAAYAHHGF